MFAFVVETCLCPGFQVGSHLVHRISVGAASTKSAQVKHKANCTALPKARREIQ